MKCLKRQVTLYTCDICQKEGEWSDYWCWFGPIEKVMCQVCSHECKHKYIEENHKKCASK